MNEAKRNECMLDPFVGLSGFRCIVADPPWRVKRGPPLAGYKVENGRQIWANTGLPTQDLAYPTMTVDEIMGLPVSGVADKDAHLYLWTINRYVEQAYSVARAWGFRPVCLLTWVKKPRSGLGGCYKSATEWCLFCRRGSLQSLRTVNKNWFDWKRPYDERGKPKHSAKPEAFQDMVETVSPGPRLELFARRPREGWTVWGNEVEANAALSGGEAVRSKGIVGNS